MIEEPPKPPVVDPEEEREIAEAVAVERAAELSEKEFPPTVYTVGSADEKPKKQKRLAKGQGVAKSKKEVPQYPIEFEGVNPPKSIWENRYIGLGKHPIPDTTPQQFTTGILHLCGRGHKEAPVPVMFVSPCVLSEEVSSRVSTKPMMARGASGNFLLDRLEKIGIGEQDWYYTAIAKYVKHKAKLNQQDINWGLAALEDEINFLKPRIIVCFGKVVFDFFIGHKKFKVADVQGAFFYHEKYQCQIYLMDSPNVATYKPEFRDRFETDLQQIKHAIDADRGVVRATVPLHYEVITNARQLSGLMARLLVQKVCLMSVDAEWHGHTAWGGNLRGFQFCWAPGRAAYIRFRNEKMEYVFDVPMETVQQILAPVFNNPAMRFIGHNGAADIPWMDNHLGIIVYKKFAFDTLFAQHTVNEYADLKLERLSVKFTDLGRYDIPLMLWKKSNKFDEKNEPGYGRVPGEILEPYGLRDVDTTFRCYFPLYKQLTKAGLLKYYNEFLLPFVTDGFYELMQCGLPINIEALNEMREVFADNQKKLLHAFIIEVANEAYDKLRNVIRNLTSAEGPEYGEQAATEIIDLIKTHDREAVAQADELFNALLCPANGTKLEVAGERITPATAKERYYPLFQHASEVHAFKIDSTLHLRRWLFDVKGLIPIKTTKRNGIQLAWSKVLQLDAKQRAELNPVPAADKGTLKIYAEQDPLVAQIQELKSVGNILKAFLGGIEDEDGLDKGCERGLHKWIQPDGKIHANFSLTETARPRTWNPNVLNWPKAVTKPIEKGFERIAQAEVAVLRKKYEAIPVENEADRNAIEAEIQRQMKKPTSLRANVQAPEGFCIIDMDLKTAEVVALAYQANDENMIRVLTEPDTQFARIDKENPKKVVRIAFNENENIPPEAWDESLIVSMNDPRILRHPDGSIMHPKRDLHWEMGCGVVGKPREKCDERLVRDGCGKVGNFSIPYGASAGSLNRLIEINTGIKPDDSTGKDMISAWCKRYAIADAFLQSMEGIVIKPGWWRSLSGRVRHFEYASIMDINEFSTYQKKGILQGLARQSRNFPMQELVAATTGKALLMFIEERRKLQLRSQIGILLYDAMTAFVPLTEAKVAEKLLRECLTTRCQWDTAGGRFNFEVDTSIGFRWGVKPSKEEKKLIESYMQ